MTAPRAVLALLVLLNLAAGCGGASSEEQPAQAASSRAASPSSPSAGGTTGAAAVAPAAPAKRVRPARSYTFDGFKLGAVYGTSVMARPPYNEPCDNDPIDRKARRFMVYGAKPCRDRAFPEATTVAFLIRFADGPDEYNQPIEAFAWLGGGYFSSRSDFPARTGQRFAAVNEALGTPLETFSTGKRGEGLTVQRHPGDVYSILSGDVAVGFVAGLMPEDPENEQWTGLLQMYEKYTKPR